jgi:hypothetical protein
MDRGGRILMKIKDWDCDLVLSGYVDSGNTAILLVDKTDGERIATATVNLSEKLPEDQAYIKDYSENVGMLDALKKAGFIKEVLSYRASGFVLIPKCKLDLVKIKEACVNV